MLFALLTCNFEFSYIKIRKKQSAFTATTLDEIAHFKMNYCTNGRILFNGAKVLVQVAITQYITQTSVHYIFHDVKFVSSFCIVLVYLLVLFIFSFKKMPL